MAIKGEWADGVWAPGVWCDQCGEPMVKRTGKYGPFWGCNGYPNCKHTEAA